MGRIPETTTSPRAVFRACVWEATTRKVGNVHPNADFPDLAFLDFLIAAGEIQDVIGHAYQCRMPGRYQIPVLGNRIRMAVEGTRYAVGTNPNLGIILLLAPLAAVRFDFPNPPGTPARQDLATVLDGLTVDDARYVFEAIRIANPGGLGHSPEQDVRNVPTVTLLEAMKLAADRDLVARQYATGFADVFDFGVPAFLAAFERFGSVEAAIIDSQLRWLAAYPDSLIARKNGPAVAADVQARAAEVLSLGGIATPDGRQAGVALDRHLRSDGNKLNPGTTADLITACLFVALRENKVTPSAPFRWHTDEWL
ncbi:MAG: triphosphoribosyl-dephospho-CoA synthetase [Isosphaera sp.]|nr:triphosphoribosyl-dephospho-CoA synthetase [Isosphaera sp.]